MYDLCTFPVCTLHLNKFFFKRETVSTVNLGMEGDQVISQIPDCAITT